MLSVQTTCSPHLRRHNPLLLNSIFAPLKAVRMMVYIWLCWFNPNFAKFWKSCRRKSLLLLDWKFSCLTKFDWINKVIYLLVWNIVDFWNSQVIIVILDIIIKRKMRGSPHHGFATIYTLRMWISIYAEIRKMWGKVELLVKYPSMSSKCRVNTPEYP